jgi:hypothetical protein
MMNLDKILPRYEKYRGIFIFFLILLTISLYFRTKNDIISLII